MTFKTLMKLRNMVVSSILEIDALIEKADENYKEFNKQLDEAEAQYPINEELVKHLQEKIKYWLEQWDKLTSKKSEFEFYLKDIEEAELK